MLAGFVAGQAASLPLRHGSRRFLVQCVEREAFNRIVSDDLDLWRARDVTDHDRFVKVERPWRARTGVEMLDPGF